MEKKEKKKKESETKKFWTTKLRNIVEYREEDWMGKKVILSAVPRLLESLLDCD